LQVEVEYINNYCKTGGITPLPGICLPPLGDVVYLNSLQSPHRDIVKGLVVTAGVYDDPEQQLQRELEINLSDGNTYIIGTSQSGKTTMLQTLVYSIMDNYTPDEANIYIIDCGNMAMKVFEGGSHIGGVALPAEEERIGNLFRMLSSEIDIRKALFSKSSVGTFKAYKEAGFRDLPQILLIIDNIAAFREYYGQYGVKNVGLGHAVKYRLVYGGHYMLYKVGSAAFFPSRNCHHAQGQ